MIQIYTTSLCSYVYEISKIKQKKKKYYSLISLSYKDSPAAILLTTFNVFFLNQLVE